MTLKICPASRFISCPYMVFTREQFSCTNKMEGRNKVERVSSINVVLRIEFSLLSVLLFEQNETLIAVKAPHGTTLEVPDPDEV